jgi:hypothetical protein
MLDTRIESIYGLTGERPTIFIDNGPGDLRALQTEKCKHVQRRVYEDKPGPRRALSVRIMLPITVEHE